MPKVKTLTLGGGETAVKFEKSYPYYFVSNMGDDNIYASAKSSITAYAEGVYTVLPGIETRISPERLDGTIYLLGSGTVQVRAEEIAESVSFKAVPKGGGGESEGSTNTIQFLNGSIISPSKVNEVDLNDFTKNAIYVLNSNIAGSFINSPTGSYCWGTFIVINVGGVTLQLYFHDSTNDAYYRSKWRGSTSWKGWYRM